MSKKNLSTGVVLLLENSLLFVFAIQVPVSDKEKLDLSKHISQGAKPPGCTIIASYANGHFSSGQQNR